MSAKPVFDDVPPLISLADLATHYVSVHSQAKIDRLRAIIHGRELDTLTERVKRLEADHANDVVTIEAQVATINGYKRTIEVKSAEIQGLLERLAD